MYSCHKSQCYLNKNMFTNHCWATDLEHKHKSQPQDSSDYIRQTGLILYSDQFVYIQIKEWIHISDKSCKR